MKIGSISVFFLLLVGYSHANQVLIPYFSPWKYLDDGTNPGTTWTDSSFNDNTWKIGYTQAGYGDGDESTTCGYGPDANNKYITTYFRKQLFISNATQFTGFILNVRRDDGIVVYVNGTEVYRNNMPAPPAVITYTTLASLAASDDGGTQQSASIAGTAFMTGSNIVSAEVHQNVATSTDITFDLELIGVESGSPVMSRGPYLMMATPNSIKLRWRTTTSSDSKVAYGMSPTGLVYQTTDTALTTEHIVQLSGLQPNTKYYYSIGSTAFALMNSEENYFITPPPENSVKPTRIWATGDFGNGTLQSTSVLNAYFNYAGSTYTDLWMWLGDNAYESGTDAEYTSKVFSYRYERLFRNTCIWPSPGNHDYANTGYQGTTALGTTAPYFSIFSTPQLGESGGVASNSPKYYSYNHANIHFISLDSYGSLNAPGSPMYTWLQNDLASNTQKWTIVYFHHAPYTKGSHNSDTETELINMRTNIVPLLESYKVDLVLAGHSHSYERSFLIRNHYGLETTFSPLNQVDPGSGSGLNPYVKSPVSGNIGTVYAVVGCSGRTVGGTTTGYPHNAMFTSSVSTYGSMVIDINGDTLKAKLLTNNIASPTVLDQFTIIKSDNIRVNVNVHALMEGFYQGSGAMTASIAPGVTDTLTVELASAQAPHAVIKSARSPVSLSGQASFSFADVPYASAYYLVVKHRNSLETWSADSVVMSSDTVSYDFTDASGKAFGNNLKPLGDGNFALYSGDINQDGEINATDLMLEDFNASGMLTGYLNGDLTGDAVIESADFSLLENNAYSGLTVIKP